MTKFLLALAAVAAVVAVAWLLPPRVTLARMEAVRVGMTKDEVAEVMRVPPGVYPSSLSYFSPMGPVANQAWVSRHGQLHVWYGPDGRVIFLRLLPVGPQRDWRFWE